MKIKKIEVNKLFGVFDHKIPLMNDSNITIVIGENGLGKTIILEAINSLFNNQFDFFKTIDFESFVISFDNGDSWDIEKKNDKRDLCLYITRSEGNYRSKPEIKQKPARIIIGENTNSKRNAHMHDEYLSELEFINYMDSDIARKKHNFEMEMEMEMELMRIRQAKMRMNMQFQRHRLLNSRPEQEDLAAKPKWLIEAFDKISVRLIETQRIITAKEIGGDSYVNSVKMCSTELDNMISDAVKESSDVTSRLDSTYPNRLINKLKQGVNDTFEELNTALIALDNRRKLLSSVGLGIDTQDSDILQIDESQNNLIKLLKLYIDDSHEKLNPFEELSVKLKLFQDIVNKRFKHKALQIHRGRGLVFTSTVKKNKKGEFELIPSSKLSSGEQNELILFYKLIFNSQRGDMILIDEPELSLHISWQNKFIDDLKEVTSINDVTIIIATHSPDIINDNWGLKVELQGVE